MITTLFNSGGLIKSNVLTTPAFHYEILKKPLKDASATEKIFEHDKDCKCGQHSTSTPSLLLTIVNAISKAPNSMISLKNRKFYYELGAY